jgi:transposase
MHVIGEETSQRLDVIPAQYRVIVTRRPKYACPACEQAVVQAPAPERLIKGGLPTEAMVASVLAAKYAWHLPLYRQARMLAAQGLGLTRAVLAFWVGYAAAELKPVYLRLRELIPASAKIAVDELMRRWRRCSISAVVAPSRATSGPSPEMIDPGAGPTRPPSPFSYAPGRGATDSSCSRAIAASCSAMAMPPTRRLPPRPARPSRSPSVKRICGAGSSTLPRAVTRRSRAKRLSGSPRSMRSRRRSAE